MTAQTFVIGIVVLIIIVSVGYVNYKATLKRSKQIYCDVNCKDEASCDFLESDKK